MSCGVGRRCGSDLALLWLWHRLAATAPIGLLAWEPPCATSAALKKKKEKEYGKVSTMTQLGGPPTVYVPQLELSIIATPCIKLRIKLHRTPCIKL